MLQYNMIGVTLPPGCLLCGVVLLFRSCTRRVELPGRGVIGGGHCGRSTPFHPRNDH